jgi:NhaP-type Na+/H+ and K+/H+ antiporter
VTDEERFVIINNDFEIGYLLVAFALLGIILVGGLLTALHLERWHPKLVGATIGALLAFALIEAVPLIT